MLLAEDWDGLSQTILVAGSRHSAGVTRARVSAGNFGIPRLIPAGTPITIQYIDGKAIITGLGQTDVQILCDTFERTLESTIVTDGDIFTLGRASAGWSWTGSRVVPSAPATVEIDGNQLFVGPAFDGIEFLVTRTKFNPFVLELRFKSDMDSDQGHHVIEAYLHDPRINFKLSVQWFINFEEETLIIHSPFDSDSYSIPLSASSNDWHILRWDHSISQNYAKFWAPNFESEPDDWFVELLNPSYPYHGSLGLHQLGDVLLARRPEELTPQFTEFGLAFYQWHEFGAHYTAYVDAIRTANCVETV